MKIIELCQKSCSVKPILQSLTTEQKNQALYKAAECLLQQTDKILAANALDMAAAIENGMSQAMQDRLRLQENRIAAMSEGLRQIAALEDPIGEVLEAFERPNGLQISKQRVPFGVIGIIYESRPNVTADAFGLCFKTGNAVILKGGSDALHSNIAITEVIQDALEQCNIPKECILLVNSKSREATIELLQMRDYIDVLIPRGGAGLIRSVLQNSAIPVIETGTGNCHIYVDKDCDITKAIPIIINAKTQRIGVCNACESLVVHQDIAETFLPVLKNEFLQKSVEMRGDAYVCETIEEAILATEEDYGTEYLDYIISIKTVASLEEAISHINQYHTKHSDAIITENEETAVKFLNQIDSACVYWNASTRFTDGFEFGFGAEIGISTQKLHARGPMGLKELTTYKYHICGNGQIRE